MAAGLEARRTLRSRLSGLTLLELQRLAEEVSIPTVNQSRGTLVNLLVGSLTPEEILDEAIACRTWKLLFACCGEVQDFDLESEIANFFPSPFSRRELLAFLRGVSLQDVERLKESDATCTADVQTRLSAEVQHVGSLMACLPEDVPQSVPEASERLRQIQFPCVHRGLLGCIMACVFHGQSCDVKKAGAFFQQPSSFSFFFEICKFWILDIHRFHWTGLQAGWKCFRWLWRTIPFMLVVVWWLLPLCRHKSRKCKWEVGMIDLQSSK